YAVLWATNSGGVPGTKATSDTFTISTTEPPHLTGLGVWKTDGTDGPPMICVLWRINGIHQEEFSGRIHFQLAPVAGGTPDATTDWYVDYDPAGNLVPDSNGEYSWCAYSYDVPASDAGRHWTPVALTGDDGFGDTLNLGSGDLAGTSITDPDGNTTPGTFTNTP
ncbi:MAG: hypothetical protein FWE75_17640, partial [Actinomycetia bacterium]|nr:hypothetical protein [Actinomycetes bacterium]